MSAQPTEAELKNYFEGYQNKATRDMAARTGLNETLCRETLEHAAQKLDAPMPGEIRGRLTVAHYRERQSYSPETGEPGTIRTEYRVRPLTDYSEEELSRRLGPDWRRFRPFSTHAVEERYVKYGKELPWEIHDIAPSRQEAMELTLFPESIPLDPMAIKLHSKMLAANAAASEKRQREEEARSAAEERGRKQRITGDVWKRMAEAPRTAPLTKVWNDYTRCNENDSSVKDRVRSDPEAMRLYREAIDSETIPARVAGMKGFLKYAAEHGLYSASCPRPEIPKGSRSRRD